MKYLKLAVLQLKSLNKWYLECILFTNFILYYHTIKHLKFSQIFWRLKYQLFSTKIQSFEHPLLREKTGIWVKPARRHPTLTNKGAFILLNESKSLASVGWNGNNCDKLWRYHQHHFDDLNAFGAINRKVTIKFNAELVQENKIGSGSGLAISNPTTHCKLDKVGVSGK